MARPTYNFISRVLRKAATLLGLMHEELPPEDDNVLFAHGAGYKDLSPWANSSVLSYPYSKKGNDERRDNRCFITKVQHRKQKVGPQHENLVVFFRHPKVSQEAFIMIERTCPDKEKEEISDEDGSKVPIMDQGAQRPHPPEKKHKSGVHDLLASSRSTSLDSLSPKNAKDKVWIYHFADKLDEIPELGRVCREMTYSNPMARPPIAEFAVLLDIVSTHAPMYSIFDGFHCYWFADAVWRGLREIWPHFEDTPKENIKQRSSRYRW